ncbi:hypothetical protein ADL21_28370 [Streptomyces albus subsp. albus]|nr:hypothetical protein ADL21_28370 [Streptomyces albus subsp. albus]
MEVVAVNDIAPAATLAHLLEYDSTYGRLGRPVGSEEGALLVAGRRIAVSSQRDPAGLDWRETGADVIVEATGRFRERDAAALHLKSGAVKVLLSAPLAWPSSRYPGFSRRGARARRVPSPGRSPPSPGCMPRWPCHCGDAGIHVTPGRPSPAAVRTAP